MTQTKDNQPLPLYRQLENSLKEAILRGDYLPGQQIPTELELSERWQVSRVTVRKAMEALTKAQLLTRISGKGTFVSNDKFQRSMSGIISFSELCRSQGRRPGARTIRSVFESPNQEVQEALGIAADKKAIVLERIRYADSTPVSLETVWFLPSFDFLLDEDFNNRSLYDVLREKYHIWFTHSSKTIELIYADSDVSHYLQVAPGYPLISITSRMEDNRAEISCLSRQLIVGDKIRFTV